MSKYAPAGGGTYYLNSSISSTDSSITLASFAEPVSETLYTMALLNTDIAYGTIAPRTASSEFISFTGITQNADGTATLTGVVRGLAKKYPFTTSSTFKLPHSGQSVFILSDVPQVYNKYVTLENAETISGLKTFSTSPVVPTGGTGTQAANNQDIANAVTGASGTATNTTFGTVKLSVAAASAPAPIVVGDNDPRVPTTAQVSYIPTSGQKDALTGTSTPSSSNPYINLQQLTGVVSAYSGSSAPTGWLLCDGSAVSRSTYSALFAITSTTFGTGDGSTTFNVPNLCSRVPVGVGTGAKVATFASRASNVITVTGLTNSTSNEFQTGEAVTYHTSSSVITGLTNDTVYYLIRTGNLTFSLATTLANAIANTAISLSSDGSGTQTFTKTLTARSLADSGGEETHALVEAELPAASAIVGNNDTRNSGAPDNNYATAGGSSTAHNNMQPFLALNYIIKT